MTTIHQHQPRVARPLGGFGQDGWKAQQPTGGTAATPGYQRDSWNASPITRTLRDEMNGSDVRRLQEALKAKGFDPGSADGDYGPKTERAVKAFQKANGLDDDGVAGPKTLAALGLASNIRRPNEEGNAEGIRAPKVSNGQFKDYRDIKRWAESQGFHVTSTNGGKHNKNSAHYQNRAIDVRTRDKSKAEVDALIRAARAAGLKVHDERKRPAGQAVWSGPHLHLEIPRR